MPQSISKAIIFDADGVTIKPQMMFSLQYQKEFGVSNDEMLPFFKGVFQKCLAGEADLKEELKSWLAKWEWQGSVDELLNYWFQSEHNIDNDVIDVIAELKQQGVKCYLATNNEKYRLAYMRKEMGFDKIFDKIFCSAEMGCRKPEQEFFAKMYDEIEKEIGATKEEILFLDDEEKNVAEAEKFGLKTHLYTTLPRFRLALR